MLVDICVLAITNKVFYLYIYFWLLGIQCYFELPIGGPSTVQRCPDDSSGCAKLVTCK